MMKHSALISKTIVILLLLFSNPSYTLAQSEKRGGVSRDSVQPTRAERSLQQEAFDESLQSSLPLNPNQIMALRKRFNQTQAAMSAHPDVPPKPVTTLHLLDLSSGSTPMVVRLAQGYVTALVFVDSTNQAWPIDSYTIGDPQAFNVQWDKKSNLLMVQGNTLYQSGNLAVTLKNLTIPIMLTLLPGQQAVDYRVDIRVPEEGPNAKHHIGRTTPEHVSCELLGVLDGIPPLGSKALRVVGNHDKTQAWVHDKRLYLRTRLIISSPAWLSMISSADGMHAYELPRFSSIVGLEKGEKIKLTIEGL